MTREQSEVLASQDVSILPDERVVDRQVDMALLGGRVEETPSSPVEADYVKVDLVVLRSQPRATTGDPRLDPKAKNPKREVSITRPGKSKMPATGAVSRRDLLANAAQPAAFQSKLQMLPFKVKGSYCVIGSELDNGPARVQLTEHPLSTNDYMLSPERVKEARLRIHRFFAPSCFVTSMLSSFSVVLTTTLAMYISILSTYYTVDVNESNVSDLGLPPTSPSAPPSPPLPPMSTQTNAAFVENITASLRNGASVAAHDAVTVYSVLYPIVTTYLIMNLAWEYAMRQELFYLFLHYKIIIDFENWAWKDRRFTGRKIASFFPYWIIGSAIVITVFNGYFGQQGGWTAVFTLILQSLPMYMWWDSTISMEKRLIPLSKFLEMKRETGEGMDLRSAADFIGGCTVVPEETLRALAASHPASKGLKAKSMAALEYCCPYPMYWIQHWEGCCHRKKGLASGDRVLYTDIVDELKSEGDKWWERRSDYRGSDHFKPDSSNTGKCCLCVKGGKEKWRHSHWASLLMQKVVPYSSDFHEIRHLILQYNAWTASVWTLLTWSLYLTLFSVGLWFRFEAQGVEAKNLAFVSTLVEGVSGPAPSSAQAGATAAAGAAFQAALG